MKAYIAQIRMNLRLTMRDRTVVFFNYLFPLIFFFIFGQLMHAEQGGAVTQIVNMVLTIGAIGGVIGAVANSMQESQIIIQLLYFPMLFLGGATFPIALMPNWLQIVAQFIPTTYLSTGLQGILRGRETILDNLSAAGVLVL